MSKEQQKKHIIDMMEKDQELGLYDIFNDEKRQGVKDLIDTHKQRLEKYSERFDNGKSEIGNPDTWGKRVIEEPKQETLEEAVNAFKKTDVYINEIKQQQERMYSEEEVIKLLIYCKTRFGGSGLEDYVYDNEVIEWFEQIKKK
jgi:hypothetical protein